MIWTYTVRTHEVALEQWAGRPTRVLPAGRHRRRWRASYVVVDLRDRLQSVPAQEVPTADGLTLKVSAVVRYRVVDPVAWVERVQHPDELIHLAAQVALREAVAVREATAAAGADRVTVAEEITSAVRAGTAEIGIEVVDLAVKDVVLPRELREAVAEVVTARHRAQARLEEARAETAALRSLANAATMLEDHPALARQRLVAALPYGSTVKLSVED